MLKPKEHMHPSTHHSQFNCFYCLMLSMNAKHKGGLDTCKGFGNPLLLPLPRLVVLLRGPLIILGESAFSGAAQALGVGVSSIFRRLIWRVVKRELLDGPLLGTSSTGSDLCRKRNASINTEKFLL